MVSHITDAIKDWIEGVVIPVDGKEGVLSRMKNPCNIFSNNKKRFVPELQKKNKNIYVI